MVNPFQIGFIVLIYFFSVVLHEVAHGVVAYMLGDPTAKDAGRLTLNPLPHIDPIGTILIPLVAVFLQFPLIGWAKPVPYNPMYFKDIRKGTFFVAAAGVTLNLTLAVIFGIGIRIMLLGHPINTLSIPVQNILFLFAFVTFANLALGIFNLIPIPPLDGSKIFWSLSSEGGRQVYYFLERYGFMILLFLIYLVPAFSGFIVLFISKGFEIVAGVPFQSILAALTI